MLYYRPILRAGKGVPQRGDDKMVSNEFSLEGKVAIVTGSGRGLGRAIALAYARAGAAVTVCARTREEVEAVAAEIRQMGCRALPLPLDVRSAPAVEEMAAATVREFGKIDILVNNVGIAVVKPFLESTEEDLRAQIDSNLWGTFFCTRAVGRHMIAQRGGKVINISSAAGEGGKRGFVCYGTTKGGIIQFTRALAIEWAPYNIHVNAIVPGAFYTRPMAAVLDDEMLGPIRVKKIPLKRYGQPEEIGGLAVLLASSASDFITGAIIPIDGGELAKQ